MTEYTKEIFDWRSIDPNIKKQIGLDVDDVFRDKIYTLFSLAKTQNITKLNSNMVAVAYFRKYTTKDKTDLKTLGQIQGKLRAIISKEKEYLDQNPNCKVKMLKRVENEKDWYTVE